MRVTAASTPRPLRLYAECVTGAAHPWNVFVLRHGHARLQRVAAGQTSDAAVEITPGLQPEETILVHRSDQVDDGARVTARR